MIYKAQSGTMTPRLVVEERDPFKVLFVLKKVLQSFL